MSPAVPAALITIKSFTFTVPASVRAKSTISVKNNDGEAHTVTAKNGAFDVKADPGGKGATFIAPGKPGRYPFVCSFHGNMQGTLVVR